MPHEFYASLRFRLDYLRNTPALKELELGIVMSASNYIEIWIESPGMVKSKPYRHRVSNGEHQDASISDSRLVEHIGIACISINTGHPPILQFGYGYGVKVSNHIGNSQFTQKPGNSATYTPVPADDYMVGQIGGFYSSSLSTRAGNLHNLPPPDADLGGQGENKRCD